MKGLLPVILVAVFGALTFWYFFDQDYTSKREWSVVQGAELRGRELPKRSHLEFSDSKEFGSCIGIVSVNGQERLWILANAKYGERLKVLPASRADGGNRVRISKSEYESIKSRVELSDDVAQFLANSVEPSL